jgi:hypothetical protein
MNIDNDNNIYQSFVNELFDTLPKNDDPDDELYRLRYSKKRKHNDTNMVIDPESIIYDTESEDEYEKKFGNYISNDFKVWQKRHIKKYKCKNKLFLSK